MANKVLILIMVISIVAVLLFFLIFYAPPHDEYMDFDPSQFNFSGLIQNNTPTIPEY